MSQSSTTDDEIVQYAHENAAEALLLRMKERLQMLERNNRRSSTITETQTPQASVIPDLGLDEDFSKFFQQPRRPIKRDNEDRPVVVRQQAEPPPPPPPTRPSAAPIVLPSSFDPFALPDEFPREVAIMKPKPPTKVVDDDIVDVSSDDQRPERVAIRGAPPAPSRPLPRPRGEDTLDVFFQRMQPPQPPINNTSLLPVSKEHITRQRRGRKPSEWVEALLEMAQGPSPRGQISRQPHLGTTAAGYAAMLSQLHGHGDSSGLPSSSALTVTVLRCCRNVLRCREVPSGLILDVIVPYSTLIGRMKTVEQTVVVVCGPLSRYDGMYGCAAIVISCGIETPHTGGPPRTQLMSQSQMLGAQARLPARDTDSFETDEGEGQWRVNIAEVEEAEAALLGDVKNIEN